MVSCEKACAADILGRRSLSCNLYAGRRKGSRTHQRRKQVGYSVDCLSTSRKMEFAHAKVLQAFQRTRFGGHAGTIWLQKGTDHQSTRQLCRVQATAVQGKLAAADERCWWISTKVVADHCQTLACHAEGIDALQEFGKTRLYLPRQDDLPTLSNQVKGSTHTACILLPWSVGTIGELLIGSADAHTKDEMPCLGHLCRGHSLML